MTRKTFSETRKSPWLNAKQRKPPKEIKPIFPLLVGDITCHARMENGKTCEKVNEVEANSQLIVSYPRPVFWIVTTCKSCGELLAGNATVREDTEA